MTTLILSLPIPLILLVHLHILRYPHANEPEYDHKIFDPRVRGLRDRTKLMEDISYFLVGCLEGGRDGARSILSTYPCVQPAEIVAFRTSLSKYLEALRHSSVYPSAKLLSSSSIKHKGKDIAEHPVGWWWKDVVVRKSLLEECSGDKFERLLLSLSTHILLKKSGTVSTPEDMSALLRSQPMVYSDLLAKHQFTRHSWSRLASGLLHRQQNLISVRQLLTSHDGALSSRYQSLSTERLVALAESKFQDLLQQLWHGKEGTRALVSLIELAGIKTSKTSEESYRAHAEILKAPVQKNQPPPPPPLPVAAAHHPSYLKRLQKSVLQSQKAKIASLGDAAVERKSLSHATIALSNSLDTGKRMLQALADALSRTRHVGRDLGTRFKLIEEKSVGNRMVPPLDLWIRDREDLIQFHPHPTPQLLDSFSLHKPEVSIETRIDEIRAALLPPWPSMPDLSAHPITVVDSEVVRNENIPMKIHPQFDIDTKMSRHSPMLMSTSPQATSKGRLGIQPHIVSPQKRSIRYSLAHTKRPSLFAAAGFFDHDDEVENEVTRLVDEACDTSGEGDKPFTLPSLTPRKPVNRIYTAGTPRSTAKKPKRSFPLVLPEPSVSLPSLAAASESFGELIMNQAAGWSDDEVTEEDDNQLTPTSVRGPRSSLNSSLQTDKNIDDDDEEDYSEEARSMTLRDILLNSDSMQFDLLDDEADEEPLQNTSFEWA